jgi:catechol 2,3-dioxygenase-like lactoylglutathione lyase family enzyme
MMERINLAKDRLDIGLFTNDIEPALRFWQQDVGAAFDHVLAVRTGHDQHRHNIDGSVLKLNHVTAALPETPFSGYRAVMIPQQGLDKPTVMADPSGVAVMLVPPGHLGIKQVGVRLAVRDLARHRRFYAEVLGLEEAAIEGHTAVRAGQTLIFLDEEPDAPAQASAYAKGFRYITFQVFDVDAEHRRVLRLGGREGMAPKDLGGGTKYSMLRDPDGNWIELGQRPPVASSIP